VTVIPVPVVEADDDENPVVKRAKARAMRAQLLSDQNGIQNRQRRLPEELTKAEKDVCYTEQAVFDARQKLAEKEMHHEEAVAKLKALRKEKSQGDAELAEITAELKRLAELV
jgi:septal ring factor EnvC (AmiA/AmiB activator)